MVSKIRLTQDKFTLVDDEDFEWLNQWKWHYDNGYATRKSPRDPITRKQTAIFMHRVIMNAQPGDIIDHINRCRWDNQKFNLRTVGAHENNVNRPQPRNNSSGCKGICWSKADEKYQPYIGYQKHLYHLGRYEDIRDAMWIRNEASRRLFGAFAELLPVPEGYIPTPETLAKMFVYLDKLPKP